MIPGDVKKNISHFRYVGITYSNNLSIWGRTELLVCLAGPDWHVKRYAIGLYR